MIAANPRIHAALQRRAFQSRQIDDEVSQLF
ncbi:hypothetical protein DO73_4639 [Burkholderia pseudomallei]|nr:hypothetical protein DO73_4639 [Burkholderia pseudomallei]